jgi:hypothetical protein
VTTTATTTAPPPPAPPSITTTTNRAAGLLSLSARTVNGRLRVRATVLGNGCAGGRVRVTISHGGLRVASKELALDPACAFSSSFTVRGRVKVSVRFLGTTTLGPVTVSKTRRIT